MFCRILSILLILAYHFTAQAQQELYFPPASEAWETQSPENLGWCTDSLESLYDFLELNDTRAFLVLKDGKIVVEKYFYNFDQDSVWYWASAGKTLTAFLAGLAQEQGALSIEEPSSKYLGDWTAAPQEQEDSITIWHQLTMTTGLDDSVDNLDCSDRECLRYLADPGTRWSYHNAPYTLISDLIEEATGQNYNLYTRDAILNKIGGAGAWLRLEYNRVFFSSPRTMARFGLMILAEGQWEDEIIMEDKQYFNSMITPSQNINPAYGYLWWLNGQERIMVPGIRRTFNQALCPPAPADMVAAMGKNSQLLNVVPSEGLVVVRMGESPSNAPVSYDLQDGIWEYLNKIICTPSNQREQITNSLKFFPNPVISGTVNLQGQPVRGSGDLMLYDISGRLVFQTRWTGSTRQINLPAHLDNGCYAYLFQSLSGQMSTGKLLLRR